MKCSSIRNPLEHRGKRNVLRSIEFIALLQDLSQKQGHVVYYGPAVFGARHEASKCSFGDPYSVLRGTATLAARFCAGIYRTLELFFAHFHWADCFFVLESPVCASVFIDENAALR